MGGAQGNRLGLHRARPAQEEPNNRVLQWQLSTRRMDTRVFHNLPEVREHAEQRFVNCNNETLYDDLRVLTHPDRRLRKDPATSNSAPR